MIALLIFKTIRSDDNIIVFCNNELIKAYESERVPSNSIQTSYDKIVWVDTRHDFQINLSDRVSRALECFVRQIQYESNSNAL